MARMIYADDLYEAMNQVGAFDALKEKRKELFTSAWGVPIIEAEPIRRGKWKECKYAIPIPMETLHIADGIMFCSECEYLALQRLVYEDGNGDLKFIKSKYCPNCGAKMDEVEE